MKFISDAIAPIAINFNLTYSNLSKLLTSFSLYDKELAKNIVSSEAKITKDEISFKQKHISRFHVNLKESIEISGLHIDILEQYSRINLSIMSIVRIISKHL